MILLNNIKKICNQLKLNNINQSVLLLSNRSAGNNNKFYQLFSTAISTKTNINNNNNNNNRLNCLLVNNNNNNNNLLLKYNNSLIQSPASSVCTTNAGPLLNSRKANQNQYSPQHHHPQSPATILQLKKRPFRKKRSEEIENNESNGYFNVIAFATAEEYNLERLQVDLIKQDLYKPITFFSTDNSGTDQDILYVTAKYKVENEPRDIFFFREGSVVLWNCTELECSNVLQFLSNYEQNSYDKLVVQDESEIMSYNYLKTDHKMSSGSGIGDDSAGNPITTVSSSPAHHTPAKLKKNSFYLSNSEDCYLEKYTFSNALITSVKLGIWESALDKYIDSMEYVTEDLKCGRRIKMSRAEVLRKTGELFALRHLINLSSDLLDTPDFYWDREQLEQLYIQTIAYFSIQRRTRVMNEKLNHCVELAELISSNLNDIHHVRLEWMIIILIMVEVGFEILHYIDRYITVVDENPEEGTVTSSD